MPRASAQAVSVMETASINLQSSFCELYPYRQKTIFRGRAHEKWVTVNIHRELSDAEVLEAISGQSDYHRGLRFGDTCTFAVIDVDRGSPYWDSIPQLRADLAEVFIRTVAYQSSSDTGGVHLYVPFDGRYRCSDVYESLKAWLEYKRYRLAGGVLELFPHRSDSFALRLPLQSGFAFLDRGVTRESISMDTALAYFSEDLALCCNDFKVARTQIQARIFAIRTDAAAVYAPESISDQFPRDNWERGQQFWLQGLQKANERHQAILDVGCYLWFGDKDRGVPARPGRFNDGERERLITEWLERSHHGYCTHINKNKWLKVQGDIERACRWRRNGDRQPYAVTEKLVERLCNVPYLTPADLQLANARRRQKARERITLAVGELQSAGKLITVSEISRVSGCARTTINRHPDLIPAAGVLLAPCSGDLSPGGAAPAASLSLLPLPVDPPSASGGGVIAFFSIFTDRRGGFYLRKRRPMKRGPPLLCCEFLFSRRLYE